MSGTLEGVCVPGFTLDSIGGVPMARITIPASILVELGCVDPLVNLQVILQDANASIEDMYSPVYEADEDDGGDGNFHEGRPRSFYGVSLEVLPATHDQIQDMYVKIQDKCDAEGSFHATILEDYVYEELTNVLRTGEEETVILAGWESYYLFRESAMVAIAGFAVGHTEISHDA